MKTTDARVDRKPKRRCGQILSTAKQADCFSLVFCATTICPIRSSREVSEVSTAIMYPSRMSGDIELPTTLRLIVDAGLGHHSIGAAQRASGFNWSRSETSSPSAPGVAARTGRIGMATKLAGFSELAAPAWTTCTLAILPWRKRRLAVGRTRITSAVLRPARSQKTNRADHPRYSQAVCMHLREARCLRAPIGKRPSRKFSVACRVRPG